MKNRFRTLWMVAAAATLFTACSKDNDFLSAPDTNRTVLLTVTASDQIANAPTSRTHIDDATQKIQWDGTSEAIRLVELTASTNKLVSAESATCTIADNKASFGVTFAANDAPDLTYAAIYPASAYLDDKDFASYKVILPSQQTPTATSFDAAADLMMTLPIGRTSQPTDENLPLQFGRVAALGKMTILNLGLASGETVAKVEFTATGKTLAGRSYLDLSTGKVKEFGYSNTAATISMDFSAITVADAASFPAWFTCLPTSLAAGDKFTVVVTSSANKTYTKEVTIPDARSLVFTSGDITTFSVDMATIEGVSQASDARTATLTYDMISAATYSFTYDTPVSYSNPADGCTWEIQANKNSGMQLNVTKTGAHITLPRFTNAITAVFIKISTGAASGTRTVSLFDGDTEIASATASNNSVCELVINSETPLYTGTIKSSSSWFVITEITVSTVACISCPDITGVAATGVTDATTTYQAVAFSTDDDTTVTCDGSIVTTAAIDHASKTVTYSVSENTTDAVREGSITLTSAANEATTTVKVSQANNSIVLWTETWGTSAVPDLSNYKNTGTTEYGISDSNFNVTYAVSNTSINISTTGGTAANAGTEPAFLYWAKTTTGTFTVSEIDLHGAAKVTLAYNQSRTYISLSYKLDDGNAVSLGAGANGVNTYDITTLGASKLTLIFNKTNASNTSALDNLSLVVAE